MPVTKDQAHMLAALAIACRPTGAPTWDAPGVVAAIQHVAHLALADVAMALLRLASDPNAKTPGGLRDTRNACWAEKLTPPGPPRHPRPDEARCACGCKGYHPEDVRANSTAGKALALAALRERAERAEVGRQALRRARVGSGAAEVLDGRESEGEGL